MIRAAKTLVATFAIAVTSLSFATASPAQTRRSWAPVSQTKTEDVHVALPYERVDAATGIIFVWQRFLPQKGKLTAARNARVRATGDTRFKRWGSTHILVGVDCDTYEIGEFETIHYTTSGSILFRDRPHPDDVEITQVIPGTVGEDLADVLCDTFR